MPARGNNCSGLAILLGERYTGQVLDTGADEHNSFVWVKLATAAGEVGIANVYAPHSPEDHAQTWMRLQDTLKAGVP